MARRVRAHLVGGPRLPGGIHRAGVLRRFQTHQAAHHTWDKSSWVHRREEDAAFDVPTGDVPSFVNEGQRAKRSSVFCCQQAQRGADEGGADALSVGSLENLAAKVEQRHTRDYGGWDRCGGRGCLRTHTVVVFMGQYTARSPLISNVQ